MDADIRPMWTTPIWIGQITADALKQLADRVGSPVDADLSPHAGSIPTLAHLEQATAAAFHLDSTRLRWRHHLSVWTPGFYRGMTYSHAALRALVVVASNPPRQHPESGLLSLHDPRAGAANVALPGLPWGRATKIPPIAGGAITVPGWLGCSIAPLRANHSMTVWTAEAVPVAP